MSAPARNMFRIFVGNLPWTIGSTELRHFASKFGPVSHAQVAFDKKTGFSKGYGFVAFSNREGFNAMKGSGSASYFLEGHTVHVSAAISNNNMPVNNANAGED